MKATLEERLWAKVDRSGGSDACWRWTGAKTTAGYGVLGVGQELRYAHRLAWIFGYGDDPGKRRVCHRCDVPACCNPAHLFVGTQADNLRDMREKDRHARGSRHGHAKLTEDAVRAIRADARRTSLVAKDYGVSARLIRFIRQGRIWRHVE